MNFNDNFHGSNFHIEENEILNITFEQLNNYLHQNLMMTWKECPFCHSSYRPIPLINEDDSPSIVENLLIGHNNNAIWSFILQCINCGNLSLIHTEAVRSWLEQQSSLNERCLNKKDDNNDKS